MSNTVKYSPSAEELEFLANARLVMEQLKYGNVPTAPYAPCAESFSLATIEELVDNGEFLHVIGQNVTKISDKEFNFGEIAAAIHRETEMGCRPNMVAAREIYQTTIAPDAVGQKIYTGVDTFVKDGIISTNAPKSHQHIVTAAAKAAEIGIAIIATAVKDGKVVCAGISQFQGEIPVELLPYLKGVIKDIEKDGPEAAMAIAEAFVEETLDNMPAKDLVATVTRVKQIV